MAIRAAAGRAGHPQGRSEAEEPRSGLTRLAGGGYPGVFSWWV